MWCIHSIYLLSCLWRTITISETFKKRRTQIEIDSIEIGSREKQANRVALSFRDVSRYFSTIEFPIHVNPITVVRSLHRRQYIGIKKSVRGALTRGSVYPWWSGAKDASRISRFVPSRPVALTISYVKQPPGQVLFECLRNRRFCPSSDEHHCLSICLSVYRIDIREWQDRRPCSLILLSVFASLSLSLPWQPLQARRCTFVPLWEKLARASFPLLFFVRCGGFRFDGKESERRGYRTEDPGRILQDLFIYLPDSLSCLYHSRSYSSEEGFHSLGMHPSLFETTETGYSTGSF